MKLFLAILTISGLVALCHSATESPESKLFPNLNDAQRVYASNAENQGDLTASASDRTFHITKDYGGYPGSIGGYPGSIGGYPGSNGGYPGSIGGYPGGYSGYGISPGIIGSILPSTSYRGSSIPGYRGYQYPGGITSGGNVGYGYYGNYPGYSGYSGSGGYGGYSPYGYGGYGGYGDYGRGSIPGGYAGYGGSYGVGGYEDGYLGYGRGGYGRNDGYDTYGYGSGYGTNYGSTYAARSPYPYSYRGGNYANTIGSPSGYRGYS